MGFDNPRADGQPKARALLRVGSRVIGAVEAVEDPRDLAGGEMAACVPHAHLHPARPKQPQDLATTQEVEMLRLRKEVLPEVT